MITIYTSSLKIWIYLLAGVHCLSPSLVKERLGKSLSSADRLAENLLQVGLSLYTAIPGDGNCFFEAIRSQLRRLQICELSALQLRTDVVAFLRQNTAIQVWPLMR